MDLLVPNPFDVLSEHDLTTVPVRTVHAGPNPKYFGMGDGVTYYNLVSNQFTGLNGIVVPGTLRDSLVLLAVVLEQQTELNPTEIMTDTGAYADVVFGLFWLLGYRFSPRIADMGNSRLWRIDPKADYSPLNGVSQHRINADLILQHWDDLLTGWIAEAGPSSGDFDYAHAPGWRPSDQVGASRGRGRPHR